VPLIDRIEHSNAVLRVKSARCQQKKTRHHYREDNLHAARFHANLNAHVNELANSRF
jgi:hypothetical protein